MGEFMSLGKLRVLWSSYPFSYHFAPEQAMKAENAESGFTHAAGAFPYLPGI